jgi:hypothetical protein
MNVVSLNKHNISFLLFHSTNGTAGNLASGLYVKLSCVQTYTRILDKAPQKGNNWVVLLFGSEPLAPGTIAGNLLRLVASLSGVMSSGGTKNKSEKNWISSKSLYPGAKLQGCVSPLV